MSMAKASMTSETWRCQPCQLRVSLWARPSSVFAVSNASSIAQRRPSTSTSTSRGVPVGHHVVKKAIFPSLRPRRISRPRVQIVCAEPHIEEAPRIEVGQFQIGPVVKPWPLGPGAGGQPNPARGRQGERDRLGRAGHRLRLVPGVELRACSRRRARIPCPPGATPSPPRRPRRRCPPPPRRTAPRHSIARSIISTARCGLVANRTSSGTWAAARRSGSPVQALGR